MGLFFFDSFPFNAKQDWLSGCFYGQREGSLMQALVVGGGSPKNRYILSRFVFKEICATDFLRILHPDFEGEATDSERQQTTQQTSNNRNVKELDIWRNQRHNRKNGLTAKKFCLLQNSSDFIVFFLGESAMFFGCFCLCMKSEEDVTQHTQLEEKRKKKDLWLAWRERCRDEGNGVKERRGARSDRRCRRRGCNDEDEWRCQTRSTEEREARQI